MLIDIWPRDKRLALLGGHDPDVRGGRRGAAGRAARSTGSSRATSLDAVIAAIRPGAVGRELHGLSCEPFEAAGKPTVRTKEQGTVLAEGYYHGLGHGVGLEVHERPNLGRSDERWSRATSWRSSRAATAGASAACRLEDLLLVTEDGCEVLTDFPYDLSP